MSSTPRSLRSLVNEWREGFHPRSGQVKAANVCAEELEALLDAHEVMMGDGPDTAWVREQILGKKPLDAPAAKGA